MAPILDSLNRMPPQGRFGMLIRHAHRLAITDWNEAFDVLLTEQGKEDSRQLGRQLSQYGSIHLYHSPVERCAQTARAIVEGVLAAGGVGEVKGSMDDLGGPYIRDMGEAMRLASSLGSDFIRTWFDGHISEEYLLTRKKTAHIQLNTLLNQLRQTQEVTPVLVSHDWNLLTIREEFLSLRHEETGWLTFLDGLICHYQSDKPILQYLEHTTELAPLTSEST